MQSGTIYKKINLALRALLILSTLVFALFIGLLTALGWNANLNYDGETFRTLAAMLAVSIILITAGTVFCIAKKDIVALVCSVVGGILAMVAAVRAIGIAEDQGWVSTNSLYFDQPISDLWAQRLYPLLIPVGFTVLCSLLHFFSYEGKMKREEKRKHKEAIENAPAPKIVED